MNPDWTGGIKLGRDRSGGFWVLDIVRQRANPGDVERLLLDTAMQDGKRGAHRVWPEDDPTATRNSLLALMGLAMTVITPVV